jgi:ABC1 atypical kinase-like domain
MTFKMTPVIHDDITAGGSTVSSSWNALSQKLLLNGMSSSASSSYYYSAPSSALPAVASGGSSSFSFPTLEFLQDAIFQPAHALLQKSILGDALPDFSSTITDGSSIIHALEQYFAAMGVDFSSSLQLLQSSLFPSSNIIPVVVLLAMAAPILTLTAVFYALSHPPLDYRNGMEPYARGQYDYVQAKAYYSRHPLLVARRLAQVLRLSNTFLIHYLVDKYVFRRDDDPVVNTKRAQELLTLITQLGPTAIKIGQALSVRPDIINAEYSKALSTLQDQVPPFDSSLAREMLRQELGAERVARLKNINREPVASASIGQVYKATVLVNDDNAAGSNQLQVAVKVQRPNVLAEIALDLYLARELAPLYQALTKSSSDLQALANEWGRGFIVELDYTLEAAATMRFNDEMARRNLNAVVCAPRVLPQYSTARVLTTEWVDGTRLDDNSTSSGGGNAQDIPRLCSVALNAYLVMLLELQSLHW